MIVLTRDSPDTQPLSDEGPAAPQPSDQDTLLRSEQPSEVGAGTTTSVGGLVIESPSDRSKNYGSRNPDDSHDNTVERLQRDQAAERTQATEAADPEQHTLLVEGGHLETEDATNVHNVAIGEEARSSGRSPLC